MSLPPSEPVQPPIPPEMPPMPPPGPEFPKPEWPPGNLPTPDDGRPTT